MPVSEEDLQKKRESVDKLREQIQTEKLKAAGATLEQYGTVEMAQLEAEEARLQNELDAAKEAAHKTTITKSAALPLAQAKEQMKAEVARKEAKAQADKELAELESDAKAAAKEAGTDQAPVVPATTAADEAEKGGK